jgi:hypothetical protein
MTRTWWEHSWLLHHSIAAVHVALSDLDHSSGDIFLFPNMKGSLIRHQFESAEEIHKNHWSS